MSKFATERIENTFEKWWPAAFINARLPLYADPTTADFTYSPHHTSLTDEDQHIFPQLPATGGHLRDFSHSKKPKVICRKWQIRFLVYEDGRRRTCDEWSSVSVNHPVTWPAILCLYFSTAERPNAALH